MTLLSASPRSFGWRVRNGLPARATSLLLPLLWVAATLPSAAAFGQEPLAPEGAERFVQRIVISLAGRDEEKRYAVTVPGNLTGVGWRIDLAAIDASGPYAAGIPVTTVSTEATGRCTGALSAGATDRRVYVAGWVAGRGVARGELKCLVELPLIRSR